VISKKSVNLIRIAAAPAALALGLVCFAGACSSGSGASFGADETTAMPAVKVDLPPPPSFAASDIPNKYPDGDYSIRGIRKEKADTLTKKEKVKGFLLEVYQCPVCPKGQTCKLCDQPHFFLGDKADTKREKALMVVDYLAPHQRPPVLTVGKQYEVEGTFSINSPTGFGSSDGLLIFSQMTDDKNAVFHSQAEAQQAKALAGEAIEAEMEKKRLKKKK
jgi:hypothetical protein